METLAVARVSIQRRYHLSGMARSSLIHLRLLNLLGNFLGVSPWHGICLNLLRHPSKVLLVRPVPGTTFESGVAERAGNQYALVREA